MYQIITVYGGALLFAFLSERVKPMGRSNRTNFFYVLMVMLLCCFAGLRIRYNDTATYIGSYLDWNDTPDLTGFFQKGYYNLGSNPGFRFINSALKSIGADEHIFIMLYAIIFVVITLWFICKYTYRTSLSVFFFLIECYLFGFAGIKQATSTAFALIAVDAAINGKWLKYALFLFVACTIHPYCILFLIVPFVMNRRPWSSFTWVLALAFIGLAAFFGFFSSIAARIALMVGDGYSADMLTMGNGVNIFRVLVYLACFVFLFIYRDDIWGWEDDYEMRVSNVAFHLYLFAGCFMFMALFGNPILIGRLPLYFDAFMCITMSRALTCVERSRNGSLLKMMVIISFIAYFSYEEFYLKPFGNRYEAITVWQFFDSFWAMLA